MLWTTSTMLLKQERDKCWSDHLPKSLLSFCKSSKDTVCLFYYYLKCDWQLVARIIEASFFFAFSISFFLTSLIIFLYLFSLHTGLITGWFVGQEYLILWINSPFLSFKYPEDKLLASYNNDWSCLFTLMVV